MSREACHIRSTQSLTGGLQNVCHVTCRPWHVSNFSSDRLEDVGIVGTYVGGITYPKLMPGW